MRKKLAIVSSYNELCGNATYTHILKKEFEKYYEVDVIALNTFYLQGENSKLKKLALAHIDDIAKQLKKYDYVNIQFEAGLFGKKREDIVRRFKVILKASSNVIVTMHRIDLRKDLISFNFIRQIIKGKIFNILKEFRSKSYYAILYEKIIEAIKDHSNSHNANIMVHTKRDLKNVKLLFDFNNVFDHPITFLNKVEREYYIKNSQSAVIAFRKKYLLEDSDVAIGIFGFISEYKGHDTAIEALKFLPKNYKLLIFGSQHPHSIMENEKINNFLNDLKKQLITSGNRDSLYKRVVFCGALNDEEFITALHCVDFTVLPYLETNQSGSGIASLTLETKAKSLFSNNYAFFELKKYADSDIFETFDIGNSFELANKILMYSNKYEFALNAFLDKYSIENNVKLHKKIFEKK